MKTTDPRSQVNVDAEADSARRLFVDFDEGALVIAMTVVPDLYSRNRMFSLFTDARMRRARKRAIALRTTVRQLAGGGARNVVLESLSSGGHRLTYQLPQLAYARRLLLTDAERACVVFLLDRAGKPITPCQAEERALIERTLARLAPVDEALTSLASGER